MMALIIATAADERFLSGVAVLDLKMGLPKMWPFCVVSWL